MSRVRKQRTRGKRRWSVPRSWPTVSFGWPIVVASQPPSLVSSGFGELVMDRSERTIGRHPTFHPHHRSVEALVVKRSDIVAVLRFGQALAGRLRGRRAGPLVGLDETAGLRLHGVLV